MFYWIFFLWNHGIAHVWIRIRNYPLWNGLHVRSRRTRTQTVPGLHSQNHGRFA